MIKLDVSCRSPCLHTDTLERLRKMHHYSVLQRQLINIPSVIPVSFSFCFSRQTQAAVSLKSTGLKPTFTTLSNDS